MGLLQSLSKLLAKQVMMEAQGEAIKYAADDEEERRLLFLNATDMDLEELAKQRAPRVGRDVDAYLQQLKITRERAKNKEQWHAEAKKWEED